MLPQPLAVDLEQVGEHAESIAIRQQQQQLVRGLRHVEARGERVGDLMFRGRGNRRIGERALQIGVLGHQPGEGRDIAFDLDRIGFLQRDVEQGSRVAGGGGSGWHRGVLPACT